MKRLSRITINTSLMPYSLLPTLLLQILVIGYSPGPANIYSLAMSLRHGKKASFIMWLGLLIGFCIAVSVMAVLTYLLGLAVGDYVKYLGAAYLVYLAYRIYSRNGKVGEKNADCTFANGMIVQLTNAKMLLFDLTAFSTFVLPYSNRLIDLLEVGAWLILAGPGGNLVWLIAGSYLRRFFTQYGRQVDVVSAVALILCAFWILFS